MAFDFRSLLGLALLCAMLAAGCSYHRDKNGGAASGGAQTDSLSTQSSSNQTVPSFQAVSAQVFAPRCLKCHNSGSAEGYVILDNYAGAKANAGKIWNAVFVERFMPPKSQQGLSEEEAKTLSAWIQGGAPENAPTAVVPIVEPAKENIPEEFRWENVKAVVFEHTCMKCHKTFSSYDTVKGMLDDIIDVVIIKHEMPPRKSNDPLTDEQLRVLIGWVRYGTSK